MTQHLSNPQSIIHNDKESLKILTFKIYGIQSFELDVLSTNNGLFLKKLVADRLQRAPSTFKLVCQGKVIEDMAYLSRYEGLAINIILNLR